MRLLLHKVVSARTSEMKILLAGISLLLVVGSCIATEFKETSMLTYIGTYTGTKAKGIYVARFDTETGNLTSSELAAPTKNPTFLAIHPTKPLLYCVGEIDDFKGKKTGAVCAFSVDKATGKLTLLNQQASGGTGPCHLNVDKTGQCVLVANYGSGSVAALPIQPDGKLGEAKSVIQHAGSSINVSRQAGPHAHFIEVDPRNKFAIVSDLGLDKLLVYHLDPATATLSPNKPKSCSVTPGSGPRHLAFHPNGHLAYLISEMGSTLSLLEYRPGVGSFKVKQSLSTLPSDFEGHNSGAEVQVHPSGKFVYGSNRGLNSIAVFAAEPGTGKLTLVQNQSTEGKTPRHFTIDPSGKWLVAENQDSDSIVTFEIDSASGQLKPHGGKIEIGSPVCVTFFTQ
jgi:6-phosphogluconolactonase